MLRRFSHVVPAVALVPAAQKALVPAPSSVPVRFQSTSTATEGEKKESDKASSSGCGSGNGSNCPHKHRARVIVAHGGGSKPAILPKPRHAPDFDKIQEAYSHLSIREIVMTLIVLRLCRIQFLTKNAVQMLSYAHKVFGEYLTYETFVRWTIFKQFCGGASEQEVRKVLKQLNSLGVGSVLDYAAEADVPEAPEHAGEADVPPSRSMSVLLNTQDIRFKPEDEDMYDTNMKLYLLCVSHASLNVHQRGFGIAAVKLTGLCDPRILSRLTAVILKVRQMWTVLVGKEAPLEECRVVVGIRIKPEERYCSVQQFLDAIPKLVPCAPTFTKEQLDGFIKVLDPDNTGKIDYTHYTHCIISAMNNDSILPPLQPLVEHMPQLTDEEVHYYNELFRRIDTIVRVAVELNVRVMVDAEQTFYQMGIDHIVRELQRKYNKKLPIVYNTYQCYLTYMEDRVANDIARSKTEGWVWAGKMVRGAYMNQERATAAEYGYKSPIWDNIEGTHQCYNNVAKFVLQEIAEQPDKRIGVLFGSHNKTSLELIANEMLKLPENHVANISFAQLFGMADHLTMPLAKAGFPVFKYVPYGPVRETIHYLSRRAQENAAILTGGSSEVPYLRRELRYRLLPWTRKTKSSKGNEKK